VTYIASFRRQVLLTFASLFRSWYFTVPLHGSLVANVGCPTAWAYSGV